MAFRLFRHPFLAPLLALAAAVALVSVFPAAAFSAFAGGAAHLADLFYAGSVERVAEGWRLAPASFPRPVLVTRACAATDYFVLLAPVVAWRLRPLLRGPVAAAALGLALAVPLTLAINALRILAVAEAHRWVIPRFPAAYGDFLHLLVGVAVFLPALLVLNLVLRHHVSARLPSHTA